MMPGPIIIRRCLECEKLIVESTVLSGNTFGARFWTDGRMEAPMLPDQLWFVKCPHCSALVWLDELEKVGEIPWDGTPDASLTGAESFLDPSAEDYFAVLSGHALDREKELYLRHRAWWAGNDPRRQGEETGPLSSDEVANLTALAAFLDDSNSHGRIAKAEIARELGQFEEALGLLTAPVSEDHEKAASAIQDLAARRIPSVQEIKFE